MSNWGIKVSKVGFDVKTTAQKNLQLSSQYDTFKILKTGTLEISLPAETVSGTNVERTATYTHNLGYIPFFLPMTNGAVYNLDFETGGDYVVNDLGDVLIPAGAYGPGLSGEVAYVDCTSSVLTLRINRYDMLFGVDFGARKATLYYTLFLTRLDEVADYS